MGMMDRLRSWLLQPVEEERDILPWMTFNGVQYPIGLNQTLQGNREDPPRDYSAVIDYMYRNNPIVYACVNARVQLFSEARPMWRRLSSGVPGELFSTPELERLRKPWTNATTSDLLKKMGQFADTEGDAFVVRLGGRLAVPRPDWTTVIVDGDVRDLGAPVYGYIYYPGGQYSGLDPIPLDARQVAHYAPVPDPLQPHRGMSWLTPIVREVLADTAMTDHKRMFLTNGATPNLVVSLDPAIGKAAFDEWVTAFRKGHEGVANAYRTLYMGGGAKVEAVGKDLQQIDFKVVQGAGETRIAAAAGVPSVVAGFSEGMQGSSLNAGNYASSMRRFADLTMRPLWRDAFGSLASILSVPTGAELWYSDADIPALKDDIKDAAEVQALQAQAIRQYVDAGYDPATVVDAVNAGDLKRLRHSGLYSVQLQPPMPDGPAPVPATVPVAQEGA